MRQRDTFILPSLKSNRMCGQCHDALITKKQPKTSYFSGGKQTWKYCNSFTHAKVYSGHVLSQSAFLKKVWLSFITEWDPLRVIVLPHWFSHICRLDLSWRNRGALPELLASPLLWLQPALVLNDLSVCHPHNAPHCCSLSFTACHFLNSPHQPFVPGCFMFFLWREVNGIAAFGMLRNRSGWEIASAGIFHCNTLWRFHFLPLILRWQLSFSPPLKSHFQSLMAVMSVRSLDSYSKCHWHNGRQPLASFDHPCCVQEQLEPKLSVCVCVRARACVCSACTFAWLPLSGKAPQTEI